MKAVGWFSQFLDAYSQWVVRKRWYVVVVSFLVAGLLMSGLRFLESGSDYTIYFAENDARVELYEYVKNEYSEEDNVFYAVTARGGEVFDREVLTAVAALTEAAWELPHVARIDSLTTFQRVSSDGDDLLIAPLIPSPGTMTDEELSRAQTIALEEPLLKNRLVKAGSPVTGVNVVLKLPDNDSTAGVRITEAAEALRQEILAQYPVIELRMTGLIPVDTAWYLSDMADLHNLAPIMLALIFVSMLLLLKSLLLTVSVCVIVVFSALSSFGFYCWLGNLAEGQVNMLPLVVMTLAVADCIHILISMQMHMGEGMDKHAAIVKGLRINIIPVFITSLTTAIGFLCMNISKVPPSRVFGNYTAIGIFVAFLLAITLLPALVAVMPLRRSRAAASGKRWNPMGGVAELVIKHRVALLVSIGAMTLFFSFYVPSVSINNQFIEWFNKKHPVRQDSEYVMENLTGLYQVLFHHPSGEPDGISDPAYLAHLEAFTAWLQEQDGVIQVSSIADTLKQVNMAMNGDAPEAYRLPETREMAAQYLLLYEMSLPAGMDINTDVTMDKSAARLVATTRNMRSEQFLKLAEDAEAWQREHLPAHMFSPAVGAMVILAEVGRVMMDSMLLSAPLALVLVSLIMMITLRSFKYGLLSIAPNIMPLACGFGIWSFMGLDINFGMATVVTMSIGIVVDDTVHFLSKFLHARRHLGMDGESAVRYTFLSVGKALWATSFILIAGFLVMTLSQMNIFHAMGSLTAIIIVMALIGDFLLLPPILLLADRQTQEAPEMVWEGELEATTVTQEP